MVTYITLKSSPFSGVYKPVEFWQLEDQTPKHTKRHHGSVFTLREMEEATNSFSEEICLAKEDLAEFIEALCDQERYVLKVYFLTYHINTCLSLFFWWGGGR